MIDAMYMVAYYLVFGDWLYPVLYLCNLIVAIARASGLDVGVSVDATQLLAVSALASATRRILKPIFGTALDR